MFATLREPPPRGSLQDLLLQALVIKRDQIEYARTFVLIQTLVDKEKAQDALTNYKNLQFPYMQKIEKDQKSMHIKRLMSEVSRGALQVTPLMEKKVKSKLRTRVIQRSGEDLVPQARRVSKKIGGYI